MTWETRELSGSLFKNSKRDSDKAPNAKGECRIGGVLYEIAAWTKPTKNGDKWQSLSFKPKEQKPQKQESESDKTVREAVEDGDVPF